MSKEAQTLADFVFPDVDWSEIEKDLELLDVKGMLDYLDSHGLLGIGQIIAQIDPAKIANDESKNKLITLYQDYAYATGKLIEEIKGPIHKMGISFLPPTCYQSLPEIFLAGTPGLTYADLKEVKKQTNPNPTPARLLIVYQPKPDSNFSKVVSCHFTALIQHEDHVTPLFIEGYADKHGRVSKGPEPMKKLWEDNNRTIFPRTARSPFERAFAPTTNPKLAPADITVLGEMKHDDELSGGNVFGLSIDEPKKLIYHARGALALTITPEETLQLDLLFRLAEIARNRNVQTGGGLHLGSMSCLHIPLMLFVQTLGLTRSASHLPLNELFAILCDKATSAFWAEEWGHLPEDLLDESESSAFQKCTPDKIKQEVLDTLATDAFNASTSDNSPPFNAHYCNFHCPPQDPAFVSVGIRVLEVFLAPLMEYAETGEDPHRLFEVEGGSVAPPPSIFGQIMLGIPRR